MAGVVYYHQLERICWATYCMTKWAQLIYFFRLKIQHILCMAHTSVFNIQELLEHILHFLAVDKSLYPALFVCRLWYRCGAPILWRRIELKGNEVDDKFRLERFLKIVPGGGRKPAYSSKLTHLKITHYRSLSNKKIKGIAHTFPNII